MFHYTLNSFNSIRLHFSSNVGLRPSFSAQWLRWVEDTQELRTKDNSGAQWASLSAARSSLDPQDIIRDVSGSRKKKLLSDCSNGAHFSSLRNSRYASLRADWEGGGGWSNVRRNEVTGSTGIRENHIPIRGIPNGRRLHEGRSKLFITLTVYR
jgi:hypothetical protein